MSRSLTSRKAFELRQSYIGISNFFREHGTLLAAQSRTVCTIEYNHFIPARSTRRLSNLSHRKTTRRNSSSNPLTEPHCKPCTHKSLHHSLEHGPTKHYSSDLKRANVRDVIEKFSRSSIGADVRPYDWTTLEKHEVKNSQKSGIDTESIQLCGYVTAHRTTRKVDFLTIVDPLLQRSIQAVCPSVAISEALDNVSGLEQSNDDNANKIIKSHVPVIVTGSICKSYKPPSGMPLGVTTFDTIDHYTGKIRRIGHIELQVSSIKVLNDFPAHLVAKNDTKFPPERRNLQFRTDADLRASIRLRSKVKSACSAFLLEQGFDDIETPILFKSTPEGAREFVVPTRRKGFAYALPQSPQQYKQVLMASGIHCYFQFARCFRDEDLRADRQPEFTQLDLEMSFASRESVMAMTEKLVLDVIWPVADRCHRLPAAISQTRTDESKPSNPRDVNLRIPVYTYEEVMTWYGSDKPDPRLGAEIVRVDDWIPTPLKKMLTDLEDPIVEMICIRTKGQNPAQSTKFMASFMDLSTSASYMKGQYGMAGISIYDPMKPLRGLAAFGHEAASQLEEVFEPDEGDILVAQVRPNQPFVGGSTVLGNMRRDMLAFAVEQDLIEAPSHDSMFWVVDFPLFSPTEDSAPGQEGAAGICSTHHPFTAPRDDQDLSNMIDKPLNITGDHYDLVINGTEVGGGSRRIHHAQMQELIFRDVLKMKEERIDDFRHLLDALEAGCPPHAGLALGFDRIIALILDKQSVRDVIAFPKWGDGEDKFVGSPSRLTSNQLSTYQLEVVETEAKDTEPRLSMRA